MATVEKPAVINVDPEVQAAIDRALEGVRDPESMRQAAERKGNPVSVHHSCPKRWFFRF